MGTFALDLQKFAEKTKDRADDVVGTIVVRVADEIDKRSPVGDTTYWKSTPPKGYVGGHFRANWQLGVNARPSGEIPGVDFSAAVEQARAAIPEQAAGHIFWLVNNVPYANRIEDGWAHKAPQGIVGLTVTMFQSIVNEAVEALP